MEDQTFTDDVAQYMTSLAPSERGFVWPIHDLVYGNEEKDRNNQI